LKVKKKMEVKTLRDIYKNIKRNFHVMALFGNLDMLIKKIDLSLVLA
tara:strand:- start:828 stop:968 length:141 start_codon:yes stop_codon:yes gene_type:complete